MRPKTIPFVFLWLILMSFPQITRAQKALSSETVAPVTQDALLRNCSQSDIAKYAAPVMFQRTNGIAFGLSIPQNRAKQGEPLDVYIWLSNQSAHDDFVYGGCCGTSFLRWLKVLDVRGVELVSGMDVYERKRQEQGLAVVRSCTCSTEVRPFGPGFCGVIDGGDLARSDKAYKLTPGQYTVILTEPNQLPQPTAVSHAGFTISIDK